MLIRYIISSEDKRKISFTHDRYLRNRGPGYASTPSNLQRPRGLAVYRLLRTVGRTTLSMCLTGKPAQMSGGDHIIEAGVQTYMGEGCHFELFLPFT